MLRKRYEHFVGYWLDNLYKVGSLGDLDEDQMNSLLENVYGEFCTGVTTFEGAAQDSILYQIVKDNLKLYRNLEQMIQYYPSLSSTVKNDKLSDDDLKRIANFIRK